MRPVLGVSRYLLSKRLCKSRAYLKRFSCVFFAYIVHYCTVIDCVFVRLGSYLIPPIGGYLFEPVAIISFHRASPLNLLL